MKRARPLLAFLLIFSLLLCSYCITVQVSAASAAEPEDGDISIPINNTPKTLTILQTPSKLTYVAGQSLSLAGIFVKATYASGKTETLGAADLTATGFRPNTIGKQTITLYYKGRTTTYQVQVYKRGDCNSDGSVNGLDATLLLQYAAGWNVSINKVAADVTGDGKITDADATLLLKYTAGWNVTLQCA